MATTINSYSVSLSLNANEYIKNSSLSRQETNALKRAIEDARNPQERFNQSYDRLEKALAAGAISLNTYQRLLDAARAKQQAATTTTETLSQKFAKHNQELAKANQLYREQSSVNISAGAQRIASSTDKATASIVAFGSRIAGPLAIFETLRRSLTASFEVERAQASLEVLMGSAAAAEQQLKDLRAIDAESPLSFEAGIQATRTLLSFGVAAEDVTGTLRMLGDVTGADNERFKSMALAFAQVSAAGRLQGQDLRQMIDAGFNPLQEISRQTGESLVQLKERMEAGAISSREVAEAFKSATGEGGKFNGMMDKLGQTASGKFGQAASQIQQVMVKLGDAFGPLVTSVSDLVIRLVKLLEAPLWLIGKMADGLGFLVAVVNDVADAFAYSASGQADLAFRFEATNKILADIGKTANDTGSAMEAMGEAESGAASKAAAKSKEFLDNMQAILKQWQSDAASSQQAFTSQIDSMQRQVDTAMFGESQMAEIDAIRNLFDMADASQRGMREHFDQMIAQGKMMSETALAFVFNEEQMAQLEAFRSLQKQTEELQRQNQLKKDAERLEQRRAKIAADALKNAQAYFEQERQRQMEMRKTIASTGAGAGFEVGSAESARFIADQQNARIAGMVDIQGQKATDEAILDKAREQAEILTRQEQKQERMLAILERQLEVQRQNGFQRIR